jgi:hypothetical protein
MECIDPFAGYLHEARYDADDNDDGAPQGISPSFVPAFPLATTKAVRVRCSDGTWKYHGRTRRRFAAQGPCSTWVYTRLLYGALRMKPGLSPVDPQ